MLRLALLFALLLACLAVAGPPPCLAQGPCAGACNPPKGIFCSGTCVCNVTSPQDGWGSCFGY